VAGRNPPASAGTKAACAPQVEIPTLKCRGVLIRHADPAADATACAAIYAPSVTPAEPRPPPRLDVQ
jgi:hypothetical protein